MRQARSAVLVPFAAFVTASALAAQGVGSSGAPASPGGATPAPDPPRYVTARWTVRDGLPVNAVTALLQARDGYLWVATFDGLARFDGVRFTTFSVANTPGLPSNRLWAMREARDGALWLFTEQFQLVRFDRGRATTFDAAAGVDAPVRVIAEGPDTTLWVGTDRGLGAIRDGRWRAVAPGTVRGRVRAILPRADGSTLVGLDDGSLVRLVADRAQRLRPAVAGKTGPDPVLALHEDPARTLWMLTTRGLWRWPAAAGAPALVVADTVNPYNVGRALFAVGADGRTTWAALPSALVRLGPGAPRRELEFDARLVTDYPQLAPAADSGVYVTTGGATWHVARTALGSAPAVRRIDDAGSPVSALLEDREGMLWRGTHSTGLVQSKRTPVRMADVGTVRALPAAYPVTATRDGAVWYGTRTGDLVRIPPPRAAGREPARNFRDRLVFREGPGAWVRTILEDRAGRLWVGAEALHACDAHGMPAMRCARVGDPGAPANTLEQSVLALHEAADGTLWAGSALSLHRRAPGGRWQRVDAADGTPLGGVRAFAATPDGALWMGTVAGGLLRHDGRAVRRVTVADGLPSNIVRALHVDPDGWLWVGTEGRGLARLDPRQWRDGGRGRIATIDTRRGLFDDVLHQILPDDAGRLWFNTNRGLFHVARRELLDVADGRAARVHATAYTERDGLRNREGNGGSQPAGVRTADGRLWFPTQDGVAIVDPTVLGPVAAPAAIVETVRAGDTTLVAGRPAEDTPLAPGAGRRDLEIAYTAPSFASSTGLRFRYRLDGYDTAWVDAGARRAAFYTRVPPGRYTFRVLAGTADGTWSTRPAAVVLELAPRWWEARAVRALALAALALAGVLAVRWRLRLLGRRARALETLVAERTAALREREAQLEARNAQLAALNESRSRLFANLSHEFRTPLTLILAPLRSLLGGRHGPLAPSVRAQGELMERNGQRLLRLINQVLDLSRLQAGAVVLARAPHDVAGLAHATLRAFAPLAERRRLALRWAGDDAPLHATVDVEQFEKVLLNLLSNALKFTEPGGTVEVTARADGDAAVLAVRDTGVGIAAGQLPHVFDRFYQADASTTRRYEGTGIGLALARDLVELHGGTIAVESAPGVGSTFTVRLPRLAAPPAAAPADATATAARPHVEPDDEPAWSSAETPPPDGRGAAAADRTTVLLVDDNADVRAFVRTILEATYRVLEAPDGVAGLAAAREALPDLIVADVMMPGLDGLALGRALRDDPMTDAVPLVLLTARADADDQVAGLGAGADAYLTKPFEPAVLEATVAGLLAQRRRLRERFRAEGGAAVAAPAGATEADAAGAAGPPPPEPPALERRLRPLVEARLADADFDHRALADLAGLSYHQLWRGLREATGESPSRFIRRVRVERAAELLRARAGSVSEVAYSVGFASLSYFSRAFAERFGVPPSTLLRGEAEGAAPGPAEGAAPPAGTVSPRPTPR